jgi:hypothetical protein
VMTVQFRGQSVVLHHNGNSAAVSRRVFKAIVASNKVYRLRNAA